MRVRYYYDLSGQLSDDPEGNLVQLCTRCAAQHIAEVQPAAAGEEGAVCELCDGADLAGTRDKLVMASDAYSAAANAEQYDRAACAAARARLEKAQEAHRAAIAALEEPAPVPAPAPGAAQLPALAPRPFVQMARRDVRLYGNTLQGLRGALIGAPWYRPQRRRPALAMCPSRLRTLSALRCQRACRARHWYRRLTAREVA
jgi:hypothetical protein